MDRITNADQGPLSVWESINFRNVFLVLLKLVAHKLNSHFWGMQLVTVLLSELIRNECYKRYDKNYSADIWHTTMFDIIICLIDQLIIT